MTISPDKWGVHGWKFIHHVALGYPQKPTDNDKINYKNFFSLIGKILPCYVCNEHYNEHLIIHPLSDTILNNQTNLLKWTIDMHNEVNKKKYKKMLSYDEAIYLIKNNYENIQANQTNRLNNLQTNQTNRSNNLQTNQVNQTNSILLKNKYFNYKYLFIILFLIIIIILIVN